MILVRGYEMKILKCFVVVFVLVIFVGCGIDPNLKIDVSKGPNPWTNLELNNNPDNFHFAVVSDRTGRLRRGVFNRAVDKINLIRPEFVMCIGDLIQGYTEDVNEIKKQWDEFDAMVEKLDMPFFYTPGNHDMTNETMLSVWQKRFGRTYYHFVYRDVLFLCLNSEDPPNAHRSDSLSEQQLEYFRNVLAENKNVRWTFLFFHKPMWARQKSSGWDVMEKMLADRDYTVFTGHEHNYFKYVRKGQNYYVLSVTGGGYKTEDRKIREPRGTEYCEFDHIVWVTMTDNGPVISNLLLDGILDDEPCPRKIIQ